MASGIRRILAPIDLTPAAGRVQDHALALAGRSGASLTLVHVHAPGQPPGDWSTLPRPEQRWAAWAAAGSVPAEAMLEVERTEVEARDVERGLVEVLLDVLPHVLVVRTRGRHGLRRLLGGSIAEALSRRLGAITLFLPDAARGFVDGETGRVRIRRVLLPVGPSREQHQLVVDVCASLLEILGVEELDIRMVHSGTLASMPRAELPPHDGWDWDRKVGERPVLPLIREQVAAWDPDLVVMATAGHDSLADVLGSTSEQVIRHASCPVVTVPLYDLP